MAAGEEVSFAVDDESAGARLDVFLARMFPGQSRSFLGRAIEKGAVRGDGIGARASLKLRAGSRVCFTVPAPAPLSGVIQSKER